MKIYISGALQASHDLAKARALYDHAAQVLGRCGHRVYVPHQNTDPEHARDVSSASVFARDSEQMLRAEGIVAFLNEPSLGVGAELAIALNQGIKIFAFAQSGRPVSRFVQGMLAASDVTIYEYDSLADLDKELFEIRHRIGSEAA